MFSSFLIPLRAIQEKRPAKHLVESHSHPFIHQIYMTSGNAMVFCNNICINLTVGDMLLIAPYQQHMIYTVNGMTSLDLKYSCTDSLPKLKSLLTNQPFLLWQKANAVSGLLTSIIDEARAGQEYSVEIISAQIYMLLMYLLRVSNKTTQNFALMNLRENDVIPTHNSDVIQRAINYINDHIMDELTVNDLAKYLGYSKSYLSTIFKQDVLMSPQQYIILKKIDTAKNLIRQNQKSISAISDMLHFCNVQAFTNTFKKHCGISPKQYQKQNDSCTYINLSDTPLLPPQNVRDVELSYCQDIPSQID